MSGHPHGRAPGPAGGSAHGHGGRAPRGLDGAGQSPTAGGKFGRLFRWLRPGFEPANSQQELEIEALLRELAVLMVSTELNDRIDQEGAKTPDADLFTPEPRSENREIPAGYTYLGQFIDHDITFDPASSLQQQNDPDALEDFRTPRLDLDSLYGRGPDDQPYLYDRPERTTFRVGPDRGVNKQVRPDLPRADDQTALIGDKRNDENKIVRQLHALFLRFHNKVFADIARRYPGSASAPERFRETQRIVRWSYQWIVLRDFLPRVCRGDVLRQIMPRPGGREPNFDFYRPRSGAAYIPIEFSVAAFRFGHSMVRPSYKLNDIADSPAVFRSRAGKTASFARIPILVPRSSSDRDAMNGFGEALPDAWGIDWSFFFGKIPEARPGIKQVPQPSYRIDATLVDPLGALPEFVPTSGLGSPFASLAYRNLARAFRMGLPDGQGVARLMGVEPLSDELLWQKKGAGEIATDWREGSAFYAAHRGWLAGRAPLWFYLLKEAEITEQGKRLGVVGSQIVAETLIALAWFDHFSYLFQAPQWTPNLERIPGLDHDLDMLALTRYVG